MQKIARPQALAARTAVHPQDAHGALSRLYPASRGVLDARSVLVKIRSWFLGDFTRLWLRIFSGRGIVLTG